MHARELVEVAVIAASRGPSLVAGPGRLPPRSIEDYWSSSKCRLGRWARSLKSFRKAQEGSEPQTELAAQAAWRAARPVLEEIFTGEILSRTWTAVLCAHDLRHAACDAGPIGRSVMLGHLEVRQRALALSADRRYVGAQEAEALRRVQRRSERWSDFLLGSLADVCNVAEFAVDADRARDFAERLRDRDVSPCGKHAWALAVSSLRSAFTKGLCADSSNGDVNARIASSVLSCFSSEHFESTPLFRSLWLVRLDNTARDIEGLVDDLLRTEVNSPGVIVAGDARWLRNG